MDDIKMILVVPFYNEEEMLPSFLQSLSQNNKCKEVLLLMVNHGSTDKSVEVIQKYKSHFGELMIIYESSELRSVGIPRGTGFKKALEISRQLGNTLPITTIDADTNVNENFITEIIDNVPKNDLYVFPIRYQQDILKEWANTHSTEEEKSASRIALIGLDYLKFQISAVLASNGAYETRGPAGYAIASDKLESLDYKQPFNDESQPVTGESNRVGIRAYKLGLKMQRSKFVNEVHPRREFSAVNPNNKTKGYEKDKLGGEIFKIARAENYPILSVDDWNAYLDKGIARALSYLLSRSNCYGILDKMHYVFNANSKWTEIIKAYKEVLENFPPSQEELEVIGCGIHKTNFEKLVAKIGNEDFQEFCLYVHSHIPDEATLVQWSDNKNLEPAPFVYDN